MLKQYSSYLKYALPVLLVLLSLVFKIGYGFFLTLSIVLSTYYAYLFFLKKQKFNTGFWIVTNVCLAILLVGIPFIMDKAVEGEQKVKIDCSADIGKFNGKNLKVLGGNVKGRITITENPKDCSLTVYYLYILSTELAENKVGELPYLYNYTGIFGKKDSPRENLKGTGTIFALERNSTNYPLDIKSASDVSKFYGAFSGPLGVTPVPYFYSNFSKTVDLSNEGYSQIFTDNWFGIVDLKPHMKKEQSDGVGIIYTPDTKKAELSGTIVKEFNFTISE